MFFDEYCRLCNKVGKSPSACAIEMGFSKSEVTRWKCGTTPRHANMMRVADYFGVDVESLKAASAKREQPVQEDKLSDVKQMLIDSIPALSDDDVSTLLILAKQLAGRGQSGSSPQSNG